MDHFEAERRNPQIYEEVTTSSHRSFDADTEASFVQGIPQRQSVISNDEEDLFEEKLVEKKADLNKWQNKLRKCSCCLKSVALISMLCAGAHLIWPTSLHDMLEKQSRGGHHRWGGKHRGDWNDSGNKDHGHNRHPKEFDYNW